MVESQDSAHLGSEKNSVGEVLANAADEHLCGELWVRGPSLFAGYFKGTLEESCAIMDDSQWLRTGDIAVLQPNGGALEVIERAKDHFTTSAGE
jgi:long-subunit acyl-CoA synthetase (AMP-forming)